MNVGVRTAATRDVLGVAVRPLTRPQAIQEVEDTISVGGHRRYAFLNAHGANLAFVDPDFREILGHFDVLPDGIGVDLASRYVQGNPFPANLNGTDFVPTLLREARRPLRVALLGAAPGVAERAARRLTERHRRHRFVALHHGYFDEETRQRLLSSLEANPADLLLVAMGNPVQERFIAEHVREEHAHVVMGVGALLDFMSSASPRAPRWLRRVRAEWAYRLWREPRRLWRRYLLGNPLFLWRVARYGKRG